MARFIKGKLKSCPEDKVIFRDGRELTLQEVFESLQLSAYELSIDTLDMHAHKDAFHRFDRFNAKYNPVGESRLREIFLKTDNRIGGKYLAELSKQVIRELEASKYQLAEYRLSIYGKSKEEWPKLARWVIQNDLHSGSNVKWMIQIPRLYDSLHRASVVPSFETFLENIFGPLFDVTVNPKADPILHQFVECISGFDTVDDESKPETRQHPPPSDGISSGSQHPPPSAWTHSDNPPYAYYMYYLWANMARLNQLRKSLGMSLLGFRPHSGEAGDPEHLVSAFLLAQGTRAQNFNFHPPFFDFWSMM